MGTTTLLLRPTFSEFRCRRSKFCNLISYLKKKLFECYNVMTNDLMENLLYFCVNIVQVSFKAVAQFVTCNKWNTPPCFHVIVWRNRFQAIQFVHWVQKEHKSNDFWMCKIKWCRNLQCYLMYEREVYLYMEDDWTRIYNLVWILDPLYLALKLSYVWVGWNSGTILFNQSAIYLKVTWQN